MSTWRYVQNGQPCGPVETATLQALLANGALPGDTLVWQEGMTNWIAARSMAEFAAAALSVGTMPPLPAGPQPPLVVTPDTEATDIEKNKIFAVLAYLGILFLVPLLAAPQSKFARYHTNQGVVLFLTTVIIYAVSGVLMMIPFLGCLVAIVPLAVGVGALVLMIMGIINAASGLTKPLPMIGHFQLIK